MKITLIILFTGIAIYAAAQEIPITTQQYLEQTAEDAGEISDDDSFLQLWESLRLNPIQLNAVSETELAGLGLLTPLQISSFMRYRKMFGPFISVYELQAVPGWDAPTARKIASIAIAGEQQQRLFPRAKAASHTMILRLSRKFGATELNGGSPFRLLARYRFQEKRMQWGLTAEKDAGEKFFSGAQKAGFDFYSGHLFIRRNGLLRSVAIGDYVLNLGQGLVHWQGFSPGLGGDPVAIKRQSPILKPYSSAGEFHFLRGVAASFGTGRIQATFILSHRKLDANVVNDTITSFIQSGLHRTEGEIKDRGRAGLFAAGSNLAYSWSKWKAGLNIMSYHFSNPVNRGYDPYLLHSIRGRHWLNAGIEHGFTYRNFHLFGEWAVDKKLQVAVIEGLMITLHRDVDLSILVRKIGAGYQSFFGSANTMNTLPSNETGIYAGCLLRLSETVSATAYVDLHRFPWLKYRIDAPSSGVESGVQVKYSPTKKSELHFRVRHKRRERNGETRVSRPTEKVSRLDFRIHLQTEFLPSWQFRARMEVNFFQNERKPESGFLFFADLVHKPLQKPYGFGIRVSRFSTEGFESRVYAYENSVLYAYSVAALSGIGWRFYVNGELDLNRRITAWFRWAHTDYDGPGFRSRVEMPAKPGKESEFIVQIRFQLGQTNAAAHIRPK